MTPSENHSSEFERLLNLLIDEQLDDAGYARLEQMLLESAEYQWLYITEMNLHGAMAWGWSGEHVTDLLTGGEKDGDGSLRGKPSMSGEPDKPFPVVVIDASASFGPSGSSSSLLDYFSQIGPFSYMVSAVLMCVAAFAAWHWEVGEGGRGRIAATRPAATDDEVSNGETEMRESTWAATITGMNECRWTQCSVQKAGQYSVAGIDLAVSSRMTVGRQLWLESGGVEITYRTGAIVLLQGPATFEIDANGGFLSRGRLTGIFEKNTASAEDAAFSARPFTISTNAGTVVDLGTEFGVEVDSAGRMISHVFRGSVAVYPAKPPLGQDDDGRLILRERESAAVDAAADRPGAVNRIPYDPQRFVRRLTQEPAQRVKACGTGLSRRGWSEDASWQVAAISSIPDFQPQPANRIGPAHGWQVNGSGQPQWISTHVVLPDELPVGVICTFRTVVELADVDPKNAVVNGWFLTNGHVDAIRLNGLDISVPQHDKRACNLFQRFVIDHGFVEGANSLEIDVRKVGRSPGIAGYSPYVGICVGLDGIVREQ